MNKYNVFFEEANKILCEISKNISKDKGLSINYAKIYNVVTKLLKTVFGNKGYSFPINMAEIYKKFQFEVFRADLNEFVGEKAVTRINSTVGKVSIRPDFSTGGSKITVYIDKNATPAIANYALAHELCHLLVNHGNNKRYKDEYCTMPMLPKEPDELIADVFAVFLLIPFDKFLETFRDYVTRTIKMGTAPISTEDWLNYLGSIAVVPHYYVACAYEQIRFVAYQMYRIYLSSTPKERKCCIDLFGEEAIELYDLVNSSMGGDLEEIIALLYQ